MTAASQMRDHRQTASSAFTIPFSLIAAAYAGAGGLVATRQEIKQYPTRTNQIPRHIPPPHWASHPFVLFLAAGLLPFGTIFVELYFAMTSIWQACTCRSCFQLEAKRSRQCRW